MIAIWIVGILFIIIGYVIGVRKIIKMYKYKGEAVGIILDYESSTGTGNQFVRARYKYDVDGTEFIKKSEWLNNGRFCPGKECEIRYDLANPEKSYLKTFDRVLQSVIGIVFGVLGVGIIIWGIVLLGII